VGIKASRADSPTTAAGGAIDGTCLPAVRTRKVASSAAPIKPAAAAWINRARRELSRLTTESRRNRIRSSSLIRA
jgi:hypothetical protein